MSSLQASAGQLIASFAGLGAVTAMLKEMLDALKAIDVAQRQIYERSLGTGPLGQALEFQTGTVGRQQYWAETALAIQKAGALQSPQIAEQMLVSMDVAFSAQGGAKSRQVQDIAAQLAPFVGTAQLGPADVAKLFAFASAAGIAPTTEAYQDYFAQIRTGYTSSKSVDFGQFVTGLQQGGTAYLTQGGTLPEAISAYAGALAVTPSEPRAATLISQMSRLASGAMPKAREAMEAGLGVQWSALSFDERLAATLQYVSGLPEEERSALLAAAGFPTELIVEAGKLTSREAVAATSATRQKLAGASAADIRRLSGAYMETPMAAAYRGAAQRQLDATARGPGYADWQERLKQAESDFEMLTAEGRTKLLVADEAEVVTLALESLLADVQEYAATADPSRRQDLADVQDLIRQQISQTQRFALTRELTGINRRSGLEPSRAFQAIKAIPEARPAAPEPALYPFDLSQPPGRIVNYHWHNDLYLNQALGMNRQDLLIEPPDLD